MGRPSRYNNKIVVKICAELAKGRSLRTVCSIEGMPSLDTVFNWIHKYPEFSERYARAKQEAADAMAEEILDISDDGKNDWMEKHFGNQKAWVENGEALQRSRLRVDTRKWLMAKMKPKRYGETLDVTSGGEKLPTPITPLPIKEAV